MEDPFGPLVSCPVVITALYRLVMSDWMILSVFFNRNFIVRSFLASAPENFSVTGFGLID